MTCSKVTTSATSARSDLRAGEQFIRFGADTYRGSHQLANGRPKGLADVKIGPATCRERHRAGPARSAPAGGTAKRTGRLSLQGPGWSMSMSTNWPFERDFRRVFCG